jgi:hypothetical protein
MLRLAPKNHAIGTGVADERIAILQEAAVIAKSRHELWTIIANKLQARVFAEVGVFRGEFAEKMLADCPHIGLYYLIDPWRHLKDWNKPCNCTNDQFADIKMEAIQRTSFAAGRCCVLEGTTIEMADLIPDDSVDIVYIDGDHTLRGITVDLIRMLRKVSSGGIMGGDDFCANVWQHDLRFEPTLVYPFAVHFAEAIGADIAGLPFGQFAILKKKEPWRAPTFFDFTGEYSSTAIRDCLGRTLESHQSGHFWRKIWSRWRVHQTERK